MSTYKGCQFHVEDDLFGCQTCTRLVVTDVSLGVSSTPVQVWAKHVLVGKQHVLKLSDVSTNFCPVTAAALRARVKARIKARSIVTSTKPKASKPSPKKK